MLKRVGSAQWAVSGGRSLSTAHCPLPTAHSVLPTAHCLLPTGAGDQEGGALPLLFWPVVLGVVLALMLWLPGSARPSGPAGSIAGETVTIVVPAQRQSDPALGLALEDLRTVLLVEFRAAVALRTDADFPDSLPPLAVVVGQVDDDLIHRSGVDLPSLPDEGYLIQTFERNIVVVGQGPLGVAYGVFGLIERARLNPGGLFAPDRVVAAPKMTLRAVSDPLAPNYPSPEQALRWGFNAIFVDAWPSLALFDRYDPAIFDTNRYGQERAWVLANRGRVVERIARAKALHLQVLSWGDLPSLPRQTLDLYGPAVSDERDRSRFCLARERTQQLVAAQIDEVLADFPGIDVVMVRTGENYPLGPLVGNTPGEGDAAGCGNLSGFDRLRLAMGIVQREVVGRHGKRYIQRAWDLGDQGFHASPEMAAAVTRGFAGDQLMLSFKQTATDFWRYNPVNPNFGRGPIPQMAEFQAAREYEGKGAFPNFLGKLFATGTDEISPRGGVSYLYDRGVRAIWVWAKGGGWNGPEIKQDAWLDANVYAIARLAWDPDLSPSTLAANWATLRFGPAAAPFIARLLLKSDDAVLQAFYVRAYARARGPWAPNNLWIRDDVIRGGDLVRELYHHSRDRAAFDATIAEQALARRTVAEMLADFEQAEPLIADARLAAELRNTLRYEQALVDATTYYLTGMFYYYAWQDSGRADDRARDLAVENLKSWQAAWRQYDQEIVKLPGVATPYRDDGMGATAVGALGELGAGRIP